MARRKSAWLGKVAFTCTGPDDLQLHVPGTFTAETDTAEEAIEHCTLAIGRMWQDATKTQTPEGVVAQYPLRTLVTLQITYRGR